MNSVAPTPAPARFRTSPKAATAPRPQSVFTARKSAFLIPRSFRYFSRPSASISLGGLIRNTHGFPRLVTVDALDVSTPMGTQLPEAATGPDSGWMTPTLIGSPGWALVGDAAQMARTTTSMELTDKRAIGTPPGRVGVALPWNRPYTTFSAGHVNREVETD